MQIVCPKCQFARELPDDKIPANAQVATCPKCKIKFRFRDLPEDLSPPAVTAAPSLPPPLQSRAPASQAAHARHAAQADAVGGPDLPPPPGRGGSTVAPGAPPLPGSRQQMAAPPRHAAPAAPPPARAGGKPSPRAAQGDDIWKRLEAMPPEPSPPPFHPDQPSYRDGRDGRDGQAGQHVPGLPPSSVPAPPAMPAGYEDDEAPMLLDDPAPSRQRREPREVPIPFTDPNEPELLRYTRHRQTKAGQGGQPSGMRRPSFVEEQEQLHGRHGDVPWEDMARHGFLQALIGTIKAAMLSPARFFGEMPLGAGVSKPMAFAIVMGVFYALCTYLWNLAGLSSDALSGGEANPLAAIGIGLVIASPIITVVVLFIQAFFMTMALRMLKACAAGFEGTFRVTAYATAPSVLNIVPFAGPALAGLLSSIGVIFGLDPVLFQHVLALPGLWSFIVFIIGLRHMHQTSYGKIVLAMVLIAIVFVVLMFLIALAFGGMAALLFSSGGS